MQGNLKFSFILLEIVPTTLKRQSRPDARPRPSAAAGGRSFGDKPADGDRAAYR